MSHTWKHGSHLEKKSHTWKMRHAGKRVTRREVGHTWINCSNLEKWVTLKKVGHSCKNGSHLEKRVTSAKKSHNWKSGSHLEIASHLTKLITLEKIGNS